MANGTIDFTNAVTTYGSFVAISCDTGFEASGGSGTECLASGNWSTAVSCVPKGMFGLFILILHVVSYCEGNNNGYAILLADSCWHNNETVNSCCISLG